MIRLGEETLVSGPSPDYPIKPFGHETVQSPVHPSDSIDGEFHTVVPNVQLNECKGSFWLAPSVPSRPISSAATHGSSKQFNRDHRESILDSEDLSALKTWFAYVLENQMQETRASLNTQLACLQAALLEHISHLGADLSFAKRQQDQSYPTCVFYETSATTAASSEMQCLDAQLDRETIKQWELSMLPVSIHSVRNIKPPDVHASHLDEPALEEIDFKFPDVDKKHVTINPRNNQPWMATQDTGVIQFRSEYTDDCSALTAKSTPTLRELYGSMRDTESGQVRLRDRRASERSSLSFKSSAEHIIKKTNSKLVLLETLPAVVILANAITIGLSADHDPDATSWKVFEAVWTACYTAEFVFKVCIYGWRDYFCGSDHRWNWFDFLCLSISYADLTMTCLDAMTDIGNYDAGYMKILRLARLARLARALKFSVFHELKQMMLGVVTGVRVLLWAIVLLLVCIFILGVAMTNLIDHEEGFETLADSMFTVFRCFTDGCTTHTGAPLHVFLFEKYGAIFFFGYILCFMFLSIGIFNLIMAIFIDNVVTGSLKRKLQELGANQDTIEIMMKETLAKFINDDHPNWDPSMLDPKKYEKSLTYDQFGILRAKNNGSMEWGLEPSKTDFSKIFTEMEKYDLAISKELFNTWLDREEMVRMLSDADIEVCEKRHLFDVLDADMGGSLGLDELIVGLMKLRGPTTKSDIVAVRLKVGYLIGIVEEIRQKITCT